MPKFNLDEDKSLFEPIEMTIDGKLFTISKITNRVFKEVSKSAELPEQFALLTGTDIEIVEELDLLKVAKAIQLVVKHITEPFVEKSRSPSRKKAKNK